MRNRIFAKTAAVFTLVLSGASANAACPLPNTLTNGQIADASQVMGDFNAVAACAVPTPPAGPISSIQINGGSGALGSVGPLTNGQVLVGSTGSAPVPTNLSAGSGISIVNAPGSITISTTGSAAGGSSGLTLIGQVVLSAASSTLTYSSIPQSYTDLIVVIMSNGNQSGSTGDDQLGIQFNGDTGADYTWSLWSRFEGFQGLGDTAGTFGANISNDTLTENWPNSEQTIYGYAKTDRNKHWRGTASLYGGGNFGTRIIEGYWASHSGITSLTVFNRNGTTQFGVGSTITLYGRQ